MPHVVTSVVQVISLYDPNPPFQAAQNSDFSYSPTLPQNLSRNTGVASAGFPHSQDFGFQTRPTPAISPSNIPLPANSYVINYPSLVYGGGTLNDSSFSVLQINTALARIEPGFSRLRVDYTWTDTSGNLNNDTYYFDCPFYEGFNVTAQELNNIVNYVEGAAAFLQSEIDVLNNEVGYVLSRELWRGTSVTGRLTTNSITEGLQTGANVANLPAHALPGGIDEDFAAWDKEYISGPYPVLTPSEMWTSSNSGLIQKYNFPGKTAYNNYCFFYTNNPNPVKACGILAENTDGTLTFWFFSTDVNNQGESNNLVGLTQSISFIGKISPEYIAPQNPAVSGQGGGTFVFYVRGSGGAPTPSTAAGVDTANGQIWWSAKDPQCPFPLVPGGEGQYAFFSIQNANYQYSGDVKSYYATIAGIEYDSPQITTSGGTNYWFRMLVQPSGKKGDVLQWAESNHFLDLGHNSSTNWYIDASPASGNYFQNTANMTYSGVGGKASGPTPGAPNLTLLGPQDLKPTISSVTAPTNLCIGQTVTINGTNFTSAYKPYVDSLSHPLSNVSYVGTTQIKGVIPDGCPTGPASILLYDGNASDTVTATNIITVQNAPANMVVSPSVSPPGSTITITGVGFGPYNATANANEAATTVTLTSASENCSIISWSDTQIQCVIPSNAPQGLTTIYVYTSCHENTHTTMTIGQGYSFALSPGSTTVNSGSSQQFSAILTNLLTGATTDVTAETSWHIIEGPGIDGSPTSGDSTYGTMSETGLYTAPSTDPPEQSSLQPVVHAVGNYETYQGIAPIQINATASLVISPANVTLALPATQTFYAFLYFGGDSIPNDVSQEATWYVNGIANGNNEYGIIYGGNYVAPVLLPPVDTLTISATYAYADSDYQANAYVTLTAPPVSQMTIQVESQINIFLGDGRFGYIPVGTQTIGYLGEYCYVQFAEKLLPGTRTPDPTYMPIQQLNFVMKEALDSDIAMQIYNTANVQPQSDGSVLSYRTVVLGLIDPSDGLFHSMWDIANPLPAAGSTEYALSKDRTFYADQVKAFAKPHTFGGSIMEYIDDLTGGAQSQLDALISRSNIMLVGSASYDINKNKLIITDTLRILGVSDKQSYGVLGIVPEQSVIVKPNEYVYLDSSYRLKVGKFEDVFKEAYDTNVIIIGAVLDSFYTTWPLLSGVDSDTSGVKKLGDSSWTKIGQLLVQWGHTDQISLDKKAAFTTDKMKFPMAFTESCSVMAQAIETNGAYPVVNVQSHSLEDFDVHIVNSQNIPIKSKVSWFAIGI